MKVLENTPETLELVLELPRLFLWLMLGPIVGIGGLIAFAELLGGEFLQGIAWGLTLALLAYMGYFFLTRSTRLRLEAGPGRVLIRRVSSLEVKTFEFPLQSLDSAEVTDRYLRLVFSITSPATRVPLVGWAVSGGDAGYLADTINAWLKIWRDGEMNNKTA